MCQLTFRASGKLTLPLSRWNFIPNDDAQKNPNLRQNGSSRQSLIMNDAKQSHEGPDEHRHGHNHEVEISINGKPYRIREGVTSVEHLKRLAGIPHQDVLGKEVGGKFHPFAEHVEIHVHAGEVFASHPRTVVIYIDKQKFELATHELTVAQLLKLAGDDPSETTLVVKHDNRTEEFKDLNQVVRMHDGERFVVYHNKPTSVS